MTETLSGLEERIISCRRCPRLVEWRERVGREKRRAYRGEAYWARPVPGFGDAQARILVVGLAPGAHGSNRTGRMFTGDASGDFLYPALFRAGFANRPESVARGDGLVLHDLFLTAVCRCAPPENKPTSGEILNCLPYLMEEIHLLRRLLVVAALGKIAYDALVGMFRDPKFGWRTPMEAGGLRRRIRPEKPPPFAHGVEWEIRLRGESPPSLWLVGSYHPSRQNTQTGRLTRAMFDRVWRRVRTLAYPEKV